MTEQTKLQDEVDRAEWENPANWHCGWLGVYRSERDSRVWVPKQNPTYGWTVNTARPGGIAFLVAPLFVLGALFAVIIGGRR